MSSSLLFNFTVDKSTNTVFIDREFDAERSLVWDAFTKQEILDQWWAPKPLRSKTKHLDFRVGGNRFYAMVNPEGAEIAWEIINYTSITPKSNFTCANFFTDQHGAPELPSGNWNLTFSDHPDNHHVTKLSISIHFKSREEMEKMIEMGFKEGFTITLTELTNLLQTLKK